MSDSPHKSHASSDTASLEDESVSLPLSVTGNITECPLDYVLCSLLPALPASGPSIQSLKDDPNIGSDWANELAIEYNFANPEESLFNADETFDKLSALFDGVNRVCNVGRKAVLGGINTPKRAPCCEHGSKIAYRIRPDACLVLKNSKSVLTNVTKSALSWSDIAITWEYKRGGDNISKILWTMSQVMALDPCRRFTYGLTTEDLGLRVWFCDRSGYMVSEPISYLDLDCLIDIFARLSLASEEELGYDLSIARVLRDGTAQYDIRLDTPNGVRLFKTTRLLADRGVDRAVGRATRVWEGYEGSDDTKTHALKDVWVEESRSREGDIYAALLEDVSEEERRYFLTVIYHGDVQLLSGQPDTTLGIRRNHPPSDRFTTMDQLARSLADHMFLKHLIEGHSGPPRIVPEPRPFVSRAHYCIMFEEVGTPLSALRNLGTIWETVCHANMGLVVMQKRGWIHRDISARNILFCEQGGKLSDLEFAVPYDPDASPHNSNAHLTGTKDFMSAELFSHKYLYFPRRPLGKRRINHQGSRKPSEVPKPQRFLQNYLHDAESLWWAVLWTLARLDPINRTLSKDELALRQKQYLEWFPAGIRLYGNAFDDAWSGCLPDALTSTIMPPEYEPVFNILDNWREMVGYCVTLAEPSSRRFTPDGMNDLHIITQRVTAYEGNLDCMQEIGELKLLDGF